MNTHGLFWKMALPVLGLFVIAILFLIFYIPQQVEKNAVDNVVLSAQKTVGQFKTLRGYYTKSIIKKVLAGKEIRPAIDHKDEAGKIPLPATMIHDLSQLLAKEGLSLKLYSAFPFPNRASRKLDEFQANAWKSLTADPTSVVVGEQEVGGKKIVSVAVADLMVAPGCVACHNAHPDTPKNDWKLGDVRGVLQVDSDIAEQLAAGRETSLKIIGVLVVVLISILAAIFIVFKRTIGLKLGLLNAAMDDIAEGEGDLTRELELSGNDEISHLASSFNTFVAKIRGLIGEASAVSSQVASMADQMTESASQSKNAASRQDNETEVVATSVNEMTATIQEVARSAVAAADSAKEAHEATSQGQQVIETTMESIGSLAEEVEKASNVIAALKGETEHIGSVVEVINSIADQTNLLALNAAIEAARAGEQGRGFAVVADEVRSLASRTQDSTKEIQEMMMKLQQGTDDAVSVMERGRAKAAGGVETVGDATIALSQIHTAISQILDQNRQIASATEEQGAVSQEIQNSIHNISEVTHETAEVAQTTAHSSKQLAELASRLQELIGRFRI
ncbi:methyl-accepting chemotaxis protein [Motiliproteus sp. MSK22-1]|uniref:methyl-accepting chemotaxis protein n=1 Tax=Motiliproteus sp. MSK22-1 TaxID=1897630 RepID=UPI000975CA13|nr:methyl-accepting chemotaxis protein [Motiliproteus sp. MSK22-1]OMH34063.1 hypothetical protein BGP75_13175 [Motiliproteus sp. MSK22-1]